MLELIAGGAIVLSLIVYALMGGADFGGGMWDLLASGPRAAGQRQVIAHAIGPIWEANHVWLILVIVLLFTGFPAAFSTMMTSLNIPLTAMLIGIVLRGSSFVFREYDPAAHPARRRWGTVFGCASIATPFVQGATLGAFASGAIRVADGHVVTGYFAGWLSPFALGCGVFAVGLFAFLAATYLTVETSDQPRLQDDFRIRAIISGLALGPIALVVLAFARNGAPDLYRGITAWWAPLLLVWTSLCAVVALVALWRRRFAVARVAAIGQVALILVGWSLAQYPNLVIPDITLQNARAPDVTLRLLLLALGVGAIALVPSLFFLYRLFKGRSQPAP